MIKRNPNMARLKANYLFPEIQKRKEQFIAQNPKADLISLGVGDTTEPLTESVVEALVEAAVGLGTPAGYSGYGPEQGMMDLRSQIALKVYQGQFLPEEIFISDGANSDIARLQTLFGNNVTIAVQDPSYPVYIEGSLIQGVEKVVPLPCLPENDFFPDLSTAPRTDLIYFCSPNNPTGAVATREQLKNLVDFARKNRSFIIYDSVYASYIQDPAYPKSIYEIEGAEEVAIELGSFSKQAGFTGVRLAWSVVPHKLRYEDGYSVNADWNRLVCTLFNGASNIAQKGGYAVLEERGQREIQSLTDHYMTNARLMKRTLEGLGFEVFGGVHAPYLWVRFRGRKSWDIFQEFLEKYHIVCVPGSGFGPSGEGFVRFTTFGKRDKVLEAMDRLLAQ